MALGKYLVDTSGCHDCHTPWHMGANGPEPDMSRALSGHPQDIMIEAPGKFSRSLDRRHDRHQHRMERAHGA